MAFPTMDEISWKFVGQPYDLNSVLTPDEVWEKLDLSPEEVRAFLNVHIGKLNSIVDGDSGADNIGATAYDDITAETVQGQLEEQNAKFNSLLPTPDGSVTDAKLSSEAGDIKARFSDYITETTKKTPWTNVRQYALDDGSDQTVNIQAAIDSAKTILLESKTATAFYATDLVIPDYTKIKAIGDVTLKIGNSLTVGNHVKLEGFTLDCSLVPSGVHPIIFSGKTFLSMKNVKGIGLNNNSRYLHTLNSNNIDVINCTTLNGKYGLYFEKSSSCKAHNCTITTPATTGIVCVTDGTVAVSNFRLDSNTIETPGAHGIQYWSADAATETLINLRDFKASKNTINSAGGAGIWGSLGRDITYADNTINGCTTEGLDFEGSENCLAIGNTVRNARLGALAVFHGSKNVSFVGNMVYTDGAGALLGTGHNSLATQMVGYVRDDCEDISFVGNSFVNTSQTATAEINVWKGATVSHSSRAVNGLIIKDNIFKNCIIYVVGDAASIEVKNNKYARIGTTLKNVKFAVIYKSSDIIVSDNDISGDVDADLAGELGSVIYITQNGQASTYPVNKVVVSGNVIKNYPLAGVTVFTFNGTTDDGILSVKDNEVANIYYSNTVNPKLILNNYNSVTLVTSVEVAS